MKPQAKTLVCQWWNGKKWNTAKIARELKALGFRANEQDVHLVVTNMLNLRHALKQRGKSDEAKGQTDQM